MKKYDMKISQRPGLRVHLLCLLCLICLGLAAGGCGEAAEPEPVGSVYQIWQSAEWRPAYLHWLADGHLLVGSVEPPGENSQGLSYLEVMDLAEGASWNASTSMITANWFYDVRVVDDPKSGVAYLHNKLDPAAGLQFCGWQYMSYGAYIPQTAYPTAFMLGEQSLQAARLWEDWEPTGWLLEIAPGSLSRLAGLQGEPVYALAAGAAVGVDLVDYDISPDQQYYAQLNYDGRLLAADLSDGRAADWRLEPPAGLVGYSYLKFLPDNQTLAVSAACEDGSVIQIWGLAAELGAPPGLLAELAGLDPGEELYLLDAPDADRLLFATKTEVRLLNWRTGQVEKLYDAAEYLKLRWGCKRLEAPDNLHLLLDPQAARGYVQAAAYDPAGSRLAVIRYFPKEDVSQLVVLDKWQ